MEITTASDLSKVFKMGPGSIIAHRYQIMERIGAGGMGLVFKVTDRSLHNQIVALKILNPFLSQNESVIKRFTNEVLVTRTLSHPNIVRIHDIGTADEGFSYISMEYIDGESLHERLNGLRSESGEKCGMPFEQAAALLLQMLEGVSYAHEKGVIHRDLKPANVLITQAGEVKLADFGTARLAGMSTGITRDGQSVGTPDYMSPEQIRGEEVDPRCDIYSLGIIAYELVTGRKPFVADTPVAVAFKHVNEPFPKFASEEREIPQWFEALVHKASAKDKEHRFQSVDEFAQAILEQDPSLTTRKRSLQTYLLKPKPDGDEILSSGRWVFDVSQLSSAKATSDTIMRMLWAEKKAAIRVKLIGAGVVVAGLGLLLVYFSPRISGPEAGTRDGLPQISSDELRKSLEQELIASTLVPGRSLESLNAVKPEDIRAVEVEGDTTEQGAETISAAGDVSNREPDSSVAEGAAEVDTGPAAITPQQKPGQEESVQVKKSFEKRFEPGLGRERTGDITPARRDPQQGEDLLGGAWAEYRGAFTLLGSGQSHAMFLAISASAGRIQGSARIEGMGSFNVKGEEGPRGLALELDGANQTILLQGSRRPNVLRGSGRMPTTNQPATWHVELIN